MLCSKLHCQFFNLKAFSYEIRLEPAINALSLRILVYLVIFDVLRILVYLVICDFLRIIGYLMIYDSG